LNYLAGVLVALLSFFFNFPFGVLHLIFEDCLLVLLSVLAEEPLVAVLEAENVPVLYEHMLDVFAFFGVAAKDLYVRYLRILELDGLVMDFLGV
jgi:hypothetical protein